LESCRISTIRHRLSPNHLSALIRAMTSSGQISFYAAIAISKMNTKNSH